MFQIFNKCLFSGLFVQKLGYYTVTVVKRERYPYRPLTHPSSSGCKEYSVLLLGPDQIAEYLRHKYRFHTVALERVCSLLDSQNSSNLTGF